MTCLHSGNLHVCFTRGRYLGQVRGYGCRKWRNVTGLCRTEQSAFARAARAMRSEDKRVRVLFMPQSTRRNPSWYEPTLAMEGART